MRWGWNSLALAAVIAAPALGLSQTTSGAPKANPQTAEKLKAELKGKNKKQVEQLLTDRSNETKELRDKATELTVEVGQLASSGRLPQDEEALAQMKRLVDELTDIKNRLAAIEEEMATVRAFMEGLNQETLPVLLNDVADLKRNRWGNYIQFQYRDTDAKGGQADGFVLRRVRLGLTQTVDPKTTLRVSFDFAQNATGLSNNTAAQLRDAFLVYDIIPSDVQTGLNLTMGQFNMPLGYEIDRSSAEREFPERAIYNQELFPGERGRGVNARYGLSPNWVVSGGVMNSLSFNDGEQRGVTGPTGNRLAAVGGVRYSTNKMEVGLSALVGHRAGFQVGWDGTAPVVAPEVDRQYFYADATYVGLGLPGLFFRTEGFLGKDRQNISLATVSTSNGQPSGISNPADARLKERDMRGYHLILGYNINSRNTLLVKYENFDRNIDTDGDAVRGYGVSYLYYINPNARFMAAHEIFEDGLRGSVVPPGFSAGGFNQKRYGVTTFRIQYRF